MQRNRPEIGTHCTHAGRPGEVFASYPARGSFQVIGRYLDEPHEPEQFELGTTHFIAPWHDCAVAGGC